MKINRFFSTIALLSVLIPGLSFFSEASAQSLRQNVGRLRLTDSYSARIGFVPPASDGAPRRTHSGASRLPSQCGGLPLLPENGLGLTANEQLSLYVYLSPGSVVHQGRLSVTAADDSEYYETLVDFPIEQLTEAGGVMEIDIPETLPALKSDQEYSWSLVLMCNGQLRPDSPVLNGAIQRVAPVEKAQGNDISLAEKAEIYGEAGLWYDLLSTLAAMRGENPSDVEVAAHWSSVLQTVGLDSVTGAPLITHAISH
jgi:hypothetical protein